MRKITIVLLCTLLCAAAWASLTSLVRLTITTTLTSSGDLSTARDQAIVDYPIQLDPGTGNNQCDTIYVAQLGVSNGATVALDLRGTLTNSLGGAAVFAKVKAFAVRNITSTWTLTIGNASQAWETWTSASGTVTVPPGGQFLWSAPVAGATVTAATGDCLGIGCSSTSAGVASYNIIILGTSS